MRARFPALLLFCLILVACAPATPPPEIPAGSDDGPRMVLVTVPPDATPTPTPFAPDPALIFTPTPLPPTPTPLPTDTPEPTPTATPTPEPTAAPVVGGVEVPAGVEPTPGQNSGYVWGTYPGPTVWPISIQIPPPIGRIPEPDGQVVFVLLGSDQRPYGGSFRTDTMIVAVLNPRLNSVNLLSIPRDLYVYIPGWTVQRINTAMYRGGFDMLTMTLEYNLGIRPDYYIMVNFKNFVAIVDSLGGIDVDTAVALTDHRTGYGQYTVGPGRVHMDGETALWYVRSRYSTSDIDRLRRAQEVIQAIVARLLTFDALSRLPDFFSLYQQAVTTNLTLGDVTALAPVALALRNAPVNRYVIDYSMVYDWVDWSNGAMVLLPVREQLYPLLRQVLNSPN